jgi:hypothetical protein
MILLNVRFYVTVEIFRNQIPFVKSRIIIPYVLLIMVATRVEKKNKFEHRMNTSFV